MEGSDAARRWMTGGWPRPVVRARSVCEYRLAHRGELTERERRLNRDGVQDIAELEKVDMGHLMYVDQI